MGGRGALNKATALQSIGEGVGDCGGVSHGWPRSVTQADSCAVDLVVDAAYSQQCLRGPPADRAWDGVSTSSTTPTRPRGESSSQSTSPMASAAIKPSG